MKLSLWPIYHSVGFALSAIALLAAGCSSGSSISDDTSAVAVDPNAPVFETMEYRIRLVTVAEGLSYPYSLAFLPDGGTLVTEMPGRMRIIRDGKLLPEPVGGIPEVYHSGATKGLMDVALHPGFAENKLVYFTYNKSGDQGVTEVLARGVFDGANLTDVKDIFVADAWATTDGRQNSRIAFGADDTIYMTASAGGGTGLPRAQKLNDHAGKVLRIRSDGSAAPGNPFAGRSGALPEIFTLGHQNIHGIAVHPETGEVWSIEHGDEANILKPGANYGVGLPEDAPVPAGVEVTEPHISWREPDIHPSGMAFYTGDKFPRWKGNLLIGGLRTEQVHRVAFENGAPTIRENLFSNTGQWVRDVRQSPDGWIYLTTYDEPDAPGRVLRIELAQ